MDEKVRRVLTDFLELDTGIAQKSENFVGTGSNEEMLVGDMMRKVSDSLYLTRAFKSKEKGLQCFVVSNPVEDYDNDYKIKCCIEVTIVLKDDMLTGKKMKPVIDDLNGLIGEAGLKEQIVKETNALIDEINRKSEGITVTVLDSDEDGHLPEWDYNDGKYLVAVERGKDRPMMHWKDVSVHVDHITEETLEMYGPRYEDASEIKFLLKQSKEKSDAERE